MTRRIVITGCGLVSPLGSTVESLWQGLQAGRSAVAELASVPATYLPGRFGAEARQFTGAIDDFGPLEKTMARTIKKALKTMCREMQMGIAVAQLALTNANLVPAKYNLDRIGVVYGSDYMLTLPQEFAEGIKKCLVNGEFDFSCWGEYGRPAVEPLWLLKYLPNLPAAHLAIFNELHGPNNSLTLREASANLAIGEAFRTIERGHADVMVTGATGTKIHPMRTVHAYMQEEVAVGESPEKLSRPFDLQRAGEVLGEGAGALVLEELEHARARGAKILGEVAGCGSSTVANRLGKADLRKAVKNAMVMAMRDAELSPDQLGHVHAHGLGTKSADADEAQAINDVAGNKVPVVAAKGNFGNLGAGSGVVELIASLAALGEGRLFPTCNYQTPDPACPVNVVRSSDTPAGDSFVNLNFTPQGQASAIAVRKFA